MMEVQMIIRRRLVDEHIVQTQIGPVTTSAPDATKIIEAILKETAERVWSDQQVAIFEFFRDGEGNLVVRARAGTGKTTTIIEAINYTTAKKILLAAFNKKIATELQERLANPRATAKTLHSVGFGFVRSNWKNVRLDDDRDGRLAQEASGYSAPDTIVTLVKRLSALGKNACPFPTVDEMVDLAYRFDIEPDERAQDEGWNIYRIAKLAMKAMDLACRKDGTISFDDMIFVPLRNGWVRPTFDFVVIDEAQDMNASQLMLAMKVVTKDSRIVVVGDDRQAIYGFRGADSNSIDRLKGELVAHELGLTVTYRCPKAVVALANRVVKDYSAADSAPEGIVRTLAFEKMFEEALPGDFVLSRKNAPLAKTCLKFIAQGKRSMVEGREIGSGLKAVVKKLRAGSIEELLNKLTSWEDKQVARLSAVQKKSASAKMEYVMDQAEVIRVMCEYADSVSDLESKIETMFQKTDGGKMDYIVCSSVHKAKGLERNRVYGLVETLYPRKNHDCIEEQNIEYVMITRAKKEFVSVTGIN
jgi:superfamily I DNA/RNA helicase